MEAIDTTLAVAVFAFIIYDILRQRCVRGTQRRYVYATYQWALVPPSLASGPFSLLFGNDPPFWDALTVLNFVIVLWVLNRLMKDDDDNYWKRKRKQLRRYLRSFGLQPSPAGARS